MTKVKCDDCGAHFESETGWQIKMIPEQKVIDAIDLVLKDYQQGHFPPDGKHIKYRLKKELNIE